MAIGIGIGLPFREKKSLPFKSDISLKYSSLNGDYFVEDSGLNAKIVGYPVCTFKQGNAGNTFALTDNGYFNIASIGEISLSCWIKTGSNITDAQYIIGKSIAGSINGRYGVFIASSRISIITQDSTGNKVLNSTNTISTNTWYHIAATFKMNGNQELYINKVRQGTGVAIGSVGVLPNNNKFCLGGGTEITGTTHGTCFGGYITDARVFRRIITTEEIIKCYNKEIVGNEDGYWPIAEIGAVNFFYDVSGNNRHLSNIGVALLSNAWKYDAEGNKYNKNNRFSIWSGDGKVIYVPFDKNGIALDLVNGVNMDVVVYKQIDSTPSNSYNLFPCLIDFNPNNLSDIRLNIFDRSNTTIHNNVSRNSSSYDASYPFRISSLEIFNIDVLKTFFNTDYLWKIFPNVIGNSVNLYNRSVFKELLVYTTKKNDIDKLSVLKYTNDFNKFYSVDYYWENNHISAIRGNKRVVCNDAGGIKLSIDNGQTYGNVLDISSHMQNVDFAHIFENGNILFCSHRKIFISKDNLLTYSEVPVYTITGSLYTAAGDGVFVPLTYDIVTIEGKELLIWGCYGINVGVQYVDINVWCSYDNGESVRSIFKIGTTLPSVSARHIHSTNFNSLDNTIWIQTGDNVNECNKIKGSYDTKNQIWSWEFIAGDNGDDTTYHKGVGMVFFKGYAYFGMDKPNQERIGIWRVPYENLNNITYYKRMDKNLLAFGLFGKDNGEMLEITLNKNIVTTIDGEMFKKTLLIGGVNLSTETPGLSFYKGESADGYKCIDIIAEVEQSPFWQKGQVVMIKINRNN